ncbi:hypothetical protein [Pseudomonas syringae group genomosp. 3]|uniref:hypothetical protein n=1 Tax=Pseudomonas syringae group genomosp. 3 TaxID=251701 RepID=UPI000F152F1D|nr:hypothetical protein [Pseudomonas syringae group genomosp. 3]RMU37925.1 hypothetical protein ALP30_02368 [Pseudomonas syringae pv. primulae]
MNRKIIFNTLVRSPRLTAIFFILALWDFAIPEVRVYYSDKAARGLRYTWITDHRISRGGISPGGATSDAGHIFQKKDFFMHFQWWDNAGISGCVNIDPKWPTTTIHIDANGRIDLNAKGATDVKRFSPCPGGEDDFLGMPKPAAL